MAGQMGDGDTLVEDIMQSVATEHPIHEMDLTIEIDVTFETDMIMYAVRVENRTDKVIRKITIAPDIDETVFALEIRSKTLGPLPPGSAQSAIFRIRPQKEKWDLGVEGKVIGGRDVTMRALLRIAEGKTTYELTIMNRRNYSLRYLKVRPILPVNFVALEKEKTISLLKKGESATLEFELMPKTEFEMLLRHEEGLRRPWPFVPEKPRRKKRGYPRSFTREEMGEIKRFLLFTEADEELLALIGDRGLDEVAIEIGLILAYMDPIDEGAVEEDFILKKFHIGEVIDEHPLEAPHDFRPVLKLIPIEEPPLEEDFDIDELKDVRPLDIEGAKTEDIEIEPMEMDI